MRELIAVDGLSIKGFHLVGVVFLEGAGEVSEGEAEKACMWAGLGAGGEGTCKSCRAVWSLKNGRGDCWGRALSGFWLRWCCLVLGGVD